MVKPDIQQVKQRFGIIGNSTDLNRAIERALVVAPVDMSVLITGESGVGKESFPQIIHQFSHRKHGTYIAVNCGSIPEGTIDSELFGHEKGSFTGATSDRKGYFEVANGGTLFLDEVGELPLSTQARLLRVLESGEFIKVGSSKVEKTDVRLVAATNVDMVDAVNKGRFREDLYYRLNTVPITIPPLRQRKEDITLLFRKFSSDFAERYRMPAITLTDEAKDVLKNYRWPGNIRQLKNITEQISIIEQTREITPAILRSYLPSNEVGMVPFSSSADKSDQKIFNSEREILYQVLFDMKRDMTELKKIVHGLVSKGSVPPEVIADLNKDSHPSNFSVEPEVQLPAKYENVVTPLFAEPTAVNRNEVEDAIVENDFPEETLSLEEVERSMIVKALSRHQGKRKLAAQDLKISERTLYRKIKEYNLEDL
ncbi:MAG: sigma-54-dependent Fis family transcriptional regulator [Bacteroidales bacterium 45-6]|nr:MAG: sigma-54-dependent Fis family transcriptional regulator [Bacteroidales bacterium 45-6]